MIGSQVKASLTNLHSIWPLPSPFPTARSAVVHSNCVIRVLGTHEPTSPQAGFAACRRLPKQLSGLFPTPSTTAKPNMRLGASNPHASTVRCSNSISHVEVELNELC